jgi:hypothetical protein
MPMKPWAPCCSFSSPTQVHPCAPSLPPQRLEGMHVCTSCCSQVHAHGVQCPCAARRTPSLLHGVQYRFLPRTVFLRESHPLPHRLLQACTWCMHSCDTDEGRGAPPGGPLNTCTAVAAQGDLPLSAGRSTCCGEADLSACAASLQVPRCNGHSPNSPQSVAPQTITLIDLPRSCPPSPPPRLLQRMH